MDEGTAKRVGSAIRVARASLAMRGQPADPESVADEIETVEFSEYEGALLAVGELADRERGEPSRRELAVAILDGDETYGAFTDAVAEAVKPVMERLAGRTEYEVGEGSLTERGGLEGVLGLASALADVRGLGDGPEAAAKVLMSGNDVPEFGAARDRLKAIMLDDHAEWVREETLERLEHGEGTKIEEARDGAREFLECMAAGAVREKIVQAAKAMEAAETVKAGNGKAEKPEARKTR